LSDEDEEEEDGLSKSGLPSVLTRTQKLGIDLDGFFNDNQDEQVPHGLPHFPVSSGVNDQEEIDKYLKYLKRRTQGSNRVGGSSSTQNSRPQLWMLPVPVRSFHHIY
jgi:hypothetical protein